MSGEIFVNLAANVIGSVVEFPPSIDWLGNSLFSQGGGFFPVKNKDDTSTVLYVPINQTGTYTLLTHSTLFGGNSTTEPITLAAKFTNISPEMMSQNIEITEEEIFSDFEKITKNETITSENESNSKELVVSDDSNSLLLTGVAIGVAIGIAIGIVSIIVIRQKPTK